MMVLAQRVQIGHANRKAVFPFEGRHRINKLADRFQSLGLDTRQKWPHLLADQSQGFCVQANLQISFARSGGRALISKMRHATSAT
jgi:hypothetical protein